MAAYVIAQIDITDPQTFKEYQALVPATIAAYGGEYIVRGGEQVALEGQGLARLAGVRKAAGDPHGLGHGYAAAGRWRRLGVEDCSLMLFSLNVL